MKKKRIRLPFGSLLRIALCLTFFAGLACISIPAVSADSGENENIIEYIDENGIERPAFGIAADEVSEQSLLVRILSGAKEGGVPVFAVVLLSVGGAGVAGSVVWMLVKRKKKLLFQILAISLSTVIVAGGLFGFFVGGRMQTAAEDSAYRFFGAQASENAAPDPVKGYDESIPTRKILSDFEFGLEARYDRIHSVSRRYWNTEAPEYDYSPVNLPDAKRDLLKFGATEGRADNSNFWYVFPASDGAKDGIVTADYRLDYWGVSNYLAIELYDRLRLVFSAENPDSEAVNLSVSVVAMVDEQVKEYELGTYRGRSGDKVELIFDARVIPAEARETLARIRFRTDTSSLGTRADGGCYQRNDLYYAEFLCTDKAIVRNEIDGISLESEYLGTMTPTRYGAYSGTGFYDSDDGKWKTWYGGGIPEGISSDNVWYSETSDPRQGWSKQFRIKMNDHGMLNRADATPGYGGDPTVIKVDGIYYMYFTGGPREFEGRTDYVFAHTYLATSEDGLTFELHDEPIVLGSPFDGNGSYGAGAPTVCFVDGTFYMYYFTTSPLPPDNLIGCLRRTSTDGIHFGPATAVYTGDGGIADVKYVPWLKKWIAIDSPERSNGASIDVMLRLGFSDDGIHFTFGSDPFQRPAQNLSKGWQNHSAALLGDEYGNAFETMFYTYAANDIPVRSQLHNVEMDFRELEWSKLTIKGE